MILPTAELPATVCRNSALEKWLTFLPSLSPLPRDWAPGPGGIPVSSPSQCAQIRPELGVYVLGTIAPADRAMVDRHLASCPRCREEVAGLAGLPALLRKVPINAVMQLPGEPPHDPPGPPQALAGGLIGRVAAVRRRAGGAWRRPPRSWPPRPWRAGGFRPRGSTRRPGPARPCDDSSLRFVCVASED